jgi:hypothetical protein
LLLILLALTLASAVPSVSRTAQANESSRSDRLFCVLDTREPGRPREMGQVLLSVQTALDGRVTLERRLYRFSDGFSAVLYLWGFQDTVPCHGAVADSHSSDWFTFSRSAAGERPFETLVTSLAPLADHHNRDLDEKEKEFAILLLQQLRIHVAGKSPEFGPVRAPLDDLADWLGKLAEPVGPVGLRKCGLLAGPEGRARIQELERQFGAWATWTTPPVQLGSQAAWPSP